MMVPQDDQILVELTKDMRPMKAGDSRLVPADMARRLIAEGAAKNPRDRHGKPLAIAEALPEFVSRPKYLTKKKA